ncbi:DUF501 domain-containing protein [Candidatus Acetothermia bacterium]|nr:DUF501 domain-containing protein [Candidatus Acetothermia bacterium]MBI3643248.1 DUF501 domain-containing protein [Candidatus Acetothermia bacterium]
MISSADLATIEQQLGRPPRGALGVETRCPAGHPQVIRVYPLIDGKPFPTLFWLSCPNLVAQISRLEHQNYIQKIEELIRQDASFRERVFKNHRENIHERWAELSQADIVFIDKKGYRSQLLDYGIGGIKNWESVKCLHLHYAHHLARENAIGQWLDEHFQIEKCKTSS